MARGKQFTQLVSSLRAELERSTEIAVGVSDLPVLKAVLQRHYETLVREYDWPHLRRVFPRIELNAGQRYYDFPEELDFDRIEDAAVWWNSDPSPVTRGIGFSEYAAFDSESDERGDPVLRWDVRDDDGTPQIEVWPIPASTHYLQFIGIRQVPALVADSDICLLDDQLVILYAKSDLLPEKSPIRTQTLAAAQQMFQRLKGRGKAGDRTYRIGLGDGSHEPYRKAVVRVST